MAFNTVDKSTWLGILPKNLNTDVFCQLTNSSHFGQLDNSCSSKQGLRQRMFSHPGWWRPRTCPLNQGNENSIKLEACFRHKVLQVTHPFENHSLNCSWLSNKVGIMKWRRAHSSAILFWIGVPVRRRRLRQLKLSRVFQRILQQSREVPCHAFVTMCKWLIDIA